MKGVMRLGENTDQWEDLIRLLGTLSESLDFLASGPPGFLPGELDQLLADIDLIREMELDKPC